MVFLLKVLLLAGCWSEATPAREAILRSLPCGLTGPPLSHELSLGERKLLQDKCSVLRNVILCVSHLHPVIFSIPYCLEASHRSCPNLTGRAFHMDVNVRWQGSWEPPEACALLAGIAVYPPKSTSFLFSPIRNRNAHC